MRRQVGRTLNLGEAGRFSCTWTTSKSLLDELISLYSRPSHPPSSLPPPASQAPPPLLMLPRMDIRNNSRQIYRFFNPVNKKFFAITKPESLPESARAMGSSKGWVTFVGPCCGALYLWNPLCSDAQKRRRDVLRLPSAATLPCVVDIDFDEDDDSICINDYTVLNLNARWAISPLKLTKKGMMIINGSFSSAPAAAADDDDDDGNRCIALGYHGFPPSLHYSEIGGGEIGGTAWKALDSPLFDYAQVIASSKKDKLFFALSCPGEIEAWDLSDLSNIKRTLVTEAHRLFSFDDDLYSEEATDLNGHTYRKKEIDYIVESSGDLLLVTRHIAHYPDGTHDTNGCYRTIGFAVRRLDFGLRKWETINCLNGCAIFLGVSGECFSLRARDYSGLEENAIYFAPADRFSHYGGKDLGVFYMTDDRIVPYHHLDRYQTPTSSRSTTAPPFWVAPPSHLPSPN